MDKERDRAGLLDFKALAGKIEFPNSIYNGIEDGKMQAVGLVIFRIEESGEMSILLGKHRSPKNQQKHGKWGWFGETREEEDLGTFKTLYRLTGEEFERNLAKFRFFLGQGKQLTYQANFSEGDRSYSAEMLVVCTDEDLSGHISPFGEIVEAKYFPIKAILSNQIDEPMRESVLPALQQLFDQGAFETPIMPLREIVMPEPI